MNVEPRRSRAGPRSAIALLLLATVLGLDPAPAARAETPGHMTLQAVGQLGGGSPSVAVHDDFAYLALGHRIQVLALVADGKPVPVGQFVADSRVALLASGSEHIFALTSSGAFVVLDTAEPARPEAVATLPGLAPGPTFLVVNGDRAYAGTGAGRMIVLDISDPRRPTDLGQALFAPASQAAVVGGVAYLAAAEAGVLAIDVRDPQAMRQIGQFRTTGALGGIAVHAGRIYVGEQLPITFPMLLTSEPRTPPIAECNVLVLDARDPTALREVHRQPVDAEWVGQGLVVNGRLLFVSAQGGGPYRGYGGHSSILAFDLSIPAAPIEQGPVRGIPAAWLAVAGTTLLAAELGGGLARLDPDAAGPPKLRDTWRVPASPRAVTAANGYVYVGDFAHAGLWILDARRPEAALPTGLLVPSRPGFCGSDCALAVGNGVVYAADVNAGLLVFNVANPAAPRESSRLDLGREATDIAVSGDYAYLALDQSSVAGRPPGGVFVLDVSVPLAQPIPIAYVEGFRPVHLATSENDTLLVVDINGGLHVIDVSTPSQPEVLATLWLETGAGDVLSRGGYAYVSGDGGGVSVVDIRRPGESRLVATVPGMGEDHYPLRLALLDNYLLVDGLQLVDITEPERPQLVAERTDDTWPISRASDVAASNDAFIVADNSLGIVFTRPAWRAFTRHIWLPHALR